MQFGGVHHQVRGAGRAHGRIMATVKFPPQSEWNLRAVGNPVMCRLPLCGIRRIVC